MGDHTLKDGETPASGNESDEVVAANGPVAGGKPDVSPEWVDELLLAGPEREVRLRPDGPVTRTARHPRSPTGWPAGYKPLRHWSVLDRLPRAATGKLSRDLHIRRCAAEPPTAAASAAGAVSG